MKSSNSVRAARKKSQKSVSSDRGNSSYQFIRFLLVGAVAASLDLGFMILLVERAFLHYLLAGSLSFIIAVIFNYAASRAWVFQGGRYSRTLEFFGFIGVSTVGLGLNQLILAILVGMLTLPYQTAKITAIIIVAFWNYFIKKYYVFKG